ncbi:dNTP triphosphohydrolase [candidate division KSB1 bacterium]|nr:dNTP triphosphohydrolase [candidate division KSB1 bacterium]
MRDRDFIEDVEDKILSDHAVKSRCANEMRLHEEAEHPYRTAFQRDRDRIIHSRAFRRLKHKQQVFLITEGDHYRTRLTHTLEVSQISRTLAKLMGLNEDLVEAIALGHDLGHTPFGHSGEVMLHSILSGRDDLDGLIRPHDIGGFKHNYQSLWIVDELEKKYFAFNGLNLTSHVREGILKHTRLNRESIRYRELDTQAIHFEYDYAFSLEGQVVAIADEVAQRTHDLEDGIRANLVTLAEVRELPIVGEVEKDLGVVRMLKSDPYAYRNALITGLINLLVTNIATSSIDKINYIDNLTINFKLFKEPIINFGNDIDPKQQDLDYFIGERIIRIGYNTEANERNKKMIRELFRYFLRHPEQLPYYVRERLVRWPVLRHGTYESGEELDRAMRVIADFIASMTDRFAEISFRTINE